MVVCKYSYRQFPLLHSMHRRQTNRSCNFHDAFLFNIKVLGMNEVTLYESLDFDQWDKKMELKYVKLAYINFAYIKLTHVKHNTMSASTIFT